MGIIKEVSVSQELTVGDLSKEGAVEIAESQLRYMLGDYIKGYVVTDIGDNGGSFGFAAINIIKASDVHEMHEVIYQIEHNIKDNKPTAALYHVQKLFRLLEVEEIK